MEPYIGQIQAFGFNYAPLGWMTCDGQLLSIMEYSALYSLIGTTFGGDGMTTFALPDLRGRSIVHLGQSPGISNNISWGEAGGVESLSIGVGNLPAHSHPQLIPVNNGDGANSEEPQNHFPGNTGANTYNTAATPNEFFGPSNTGLTGNNQPLDSRNPYLGVLICIATEGVFPPRQ
jgi:microcystin-dependent protein